MKRRDDPAIGNFVAQRSLKSRDQMLATFKLSKTRLRVRAGVSTQSAQGLPDSVDNIAVFQGVFGTAQ